MEWIEYNESYEYNERWIPEIKSTRYTSGYYTDQVKLKWKVKSKNYTFEKPGRGGLAATKH
jgi:hypothetical protein